jgi:hypothetical protein
VDFAPTTVGLAVYEARAVGAGFARRATGCGGLGIDERGRPYLGESALFQVTNVGTDLVGIVVGQPGALSVCTGCRLGFDPAGPQVAFGGVSSLELTIPCDPNLVGRSFAVQGFATGSGSCLGFLRVSDKIDLTVR